MSGNQNEPAIWIYTHYIQSGIRALVGYMSVLWVEINAAAPLYCVDINTPEVSIGGK